ncbi:MAG: hypothetical protein KDA58_16605 [Planctomycetaceae bacterium]|nr:hypothetical protein [Planctomycetaceae bacterium]
MNSTQHHWPREFASRIASRGARVVRGWALTECIAACALLGTFCAMLVPMVGRLNELQGLLSQRESALHELRNLAEVGLTQDADAQLVPDPAIIVRLPEAEFEQTASADPDWPGTQRIDLKLSWFVRQGRPRETVQLSYWLADTSAETETSATATTATSTATTQPLVLGGQP